MTYSTDTCRYPADVERIIQVCASHGVVLSALETEKLWQNHSDLYCASWLFLPKSDGELWNALQGCV